MGYFEKNLALLKAKDSELAERVEELGKRDPLPVDYAVNGEPTIRLRGIALHSFRDPSREGDKWAGRVAFENDLPRSGKVTVLGFGLGYHLKGLAKQGIEGTVIEPDLGLFVSALKHLDLSEVLENFRIVAGVPADGIRRGRSDLLQRTILSHLPSLRLHPDALGRLSSFGEGLKSARGGGIKVLLVNPIYGGSLPVARYCASALRRMGHLVTVFASEAFSAGMDFAVNYRFGKCRSAFRNDLAEMISRSVELMAKESRPDLVLALAQAPLVSESLARLNAMDIPTAFWFVEDYRVLTYWRDIAPHYRYFFGIQKDDFKRELSSIGVSRYSYLPMAAAPQVHSPMELSAEEMEEFGSPLSFVGAGYYNRCNLFRGLTDYPFKIWGSDWPLSPPLDRLIQRNGARIDTEECVRIFNASHINLNLHSSLSHDGVVPEGDFVNPRTFEIASCGAFQLVDRRSLMDELFDAGEMELFSDLPELRERIDHYLSKPEERSRFAEQGRKRVLAEHTYEKRMEELLATILADDTELSERLRQRGDERFRLHEEIDRQEGLRDLLDRIPKGQAPTLEGIYGALNKGEGKLSRAERIFLAVKNVELKLD
jgi:spore maturation protein CgeB